MIRTETKGIAELAVALPNLGRAGAKAVHQVIVEGGKDLEETWRDNARATSGEHGKHYPNSIDSELKVSTDIVLEIGPNPNKPQGGMSFEEGSVNQPPHLDGQKAADVVLPRIDKRISSALGLLGL